MQSLPKKGGLFFDLDIVVVNHGACVTYPPTPFL